MGCSPCWHLQKGLPRYEAPKSCDNGLKGADSGVGDRPSLVCTFDRQKNTVYEDTVIEYHWENPHSHIILRIDPEAKDPSTVGTWDIETQAVNVMSRQGWNRNAYKAGDKAVVIVHPMKDGSKGGSIFLRSYIGRPPPLW